MAVTEANGNDGVADGHSGTGSVVSTLLSRKVSRRSALLVAVASIAFAPALGTTTAAAGTFLRGDDGNRSNNRGRTRSGYGQRYQRDYQYERSCRVRSNRPKLTVAAGQILTIAETTELSQLTIAAGGAIAGPEGTSLSLTVDGVEVGSTLPSLLDHDGIVTFIAAGNYRGDVVIDVATANVVTYNSKTWPFRHALYVDADGIDDGKSVESAITSGLATDSVGKNLVIKSKGQAFNGVYVAGGAYTLTSARLDFVGNGRNDFIGYGAAVLGTGGSTLIVDDANITTKGVVRTGVVADGGATVVVKNSTISTADGVVPAEYEPTGDTSFMMTCPWLLGMYGTVRATNLLGQGTKLTFLNSSVTTQTWGVLSVDSGTNCQLVAINNELKNTGSEGYGTYAIGKVTENLLGNHMSVATYATIVWNMSNDSLIHYGDSTREAVAALNTSLGLGLTDKDIAAVKPRSSVIKSKRFGFMWQAAGPVLIDGGTQLSTGETAFLSKAAAATITVDGSKGASVKPANGVIYQLMDNDNPGRVNVTGKPWTANYTASYTDYTGVAVKSATWDPTTVHTGTSGDSVGNFTSIQLKGDFYNSVVGGGAAVGTTKLEGKNLVLSFTDSVIDGLITATSARHRQSPINFTNHTELGVVTNTPGAVVNNGVIVNLAGTSTWKVTGTSYLSSLTVSAGSKIQKKSGGDATITVNGVPTTPVAGTTYTGAITVSA